MEDDRSGISYLLLTFAFMLMAAGFLMIDEDPPVDTPQVVPVEEVVCGDCD